MSIKHELRKLFWMAGYDVSRFTPASHPLAQRKRLLLHYNIDTVLDVGANSGQFAQQLKNDLGYTKSIISFEPLSSAFELLRLKAKNDPDWEVFNFALGDVEEQREINIAGNSYSSSFLDMLPSHIQSAPESRYIDKEIIEIRRLDSIFSEICNTTNKIYMKIDTQGFESKVIAGAENSLLSIGTVQLEMSLVPLYKGELLFNELYSLMVAKGYSLVGIEPGFADENSGQLLQVDGIFHRLDSGGNIA
ncbi:MAG: FkbM family methyltransferase [Cryomorphaceae bacterium]|jgi:FkbM family methyltransferase